MKKNVSIMTVILILGVMSLGFNGTAQDEDLSIDITKETLIGPGKIEVKTGKDILMSFGATVRMIPTLESNWDFGMSEKASGFLLPLNNAGADQPKNFFKDHANEAGWVNNGYIRSEEKIYFNALPKNRSWSFYAAFEYDSALETSSVDARGGKNSENSNFGLERLNASMALPMNLRIHAGWDVWHLDAFDGAGMVYGDDNPGIWITGESDRLSFSAGYFKLDENDFEASKTDLDDREDGDRDLYAGSFTFTDQGKEKENIFHIFHAYDRIRSVPSIDLLGAFSMGVLGILGKTPKTDSHHLGGYYMGKWENLEVFFEGVYQFGTAEDTGLSPDDFDIRAFALAGDISYELNLSEEFSLKPHAGVLYTSGDDDERDNRLGGYNGVVNAQRFSRRWGGENTIIGDTNLVLGTLLYGYVPELYGNGAPVFTGGIQNFAGYGGGRGDNPGLAMVSVGLTLSPKRFIVFRSNVNRFHWNESFYVTSMVNPLSGRTRVESGYVGTEWDNEVTLALSEHTFIKCQGSGFFPGDLIRDVTEALGARSEKTATRFAAELIWNF